MLNHTFENVTTLARRYPLKVGQKVMVKYGHIPCQKLHPRWAMDIDYPDLPLAKPVRAAIDHIIASLGMLGL